MKVCRNKHIPIVFMEEDTKEGNCPLCSEMKYADSRDCMIDELHDEALKREDYICKIEVENTKLQEMFKGNMVYNDLPFNNFTITYPVGPENREVEEKLGVLVPKKRSHKKKK